MSFSRLYATLITLGAVGALGSLFFVWCTVQHTLEKMDEEASLKTEIVKEGYIYTSQTPQTTITTEPDLLSETRRYILNSTPVQLIPNVAKIAIILDDMGVVPDQSEQSVTQLPKEITLSFLPYGIATERLVPLARSYGHEVMIHLPMQPESHAEEPPADPGPDALYIDLPIQEVARRTQLNLDKLKDYAVGVNNHMGSKFTAYRKGMEVVLSTVHAEDLFFLDSLTSASSQVTPAGENINIPLLKRDVFIDHYLEAVKIESALDKLVRIAQKNGQAIAIGHPHPETLEALTKWLPTLKDKNVQLVPVTSLIKK